MVVATVLLCFWAAGLTAFDYIVDFEEWIDSGYFSEEIKARLKGGQILDKTWLTVLVPTWFTYVVYSSLQ